MNEHLDERDRAILAERVALMDAITEPRVGDYVVFEDGVTRRISYAWSGGVQTSDGGSYHLGGLGYVSMSGSLYGSVKPETLTLTDEKRDGTVWFFHHDHPKADNGVHVRIPFRVFLCTLAAPQ